MTVLQCSDSTIAQNQKLDAPDRTNSTVEGTCVVGCITGPKLASSDNFRAPLCVSKNEGITFLAGYFLVWLVTRCWTSTNLAPIGVSEDCEDIPRRHLVSSSCGQSVLSLPTTLISPVFVIGQLESNSVPPYPVCEEKKCVDVATSDSFLLASDCMHTRPLVTCAMW